MLQQIAHPVNEVRVISYIIPLVFRNTVIRGQAAVLVRLISAALIRTFASPLSDATRTLGRNRTLGSCLHAGGVNVAGRHAGGGIDGPAPAPQTGMRIGSIAGRDSAASVMCGLRIRSGGYGGRVLVWLVPDGVVHGNRVGAAAYVGLGVRTAVFLEDPCAERKKVTLVFFNFNRCTPRVGLAALEPEGSQGLKVCYRPKHGSW